MLIPLTERPDPPKVGFSKRLHTLWVDVDPRYNFRTSHYAEEIRLTIAELLGQADSPELRNNLRVRVFDIMMRAWHRGDLLVEWPEVPRNDNPIPDPGLNPPLREGVAHEDRDGHLARIIGEMRGEIERLRKELELSGSFHTVAVKERDFERHLVEQLRKENLELREEVSRLRGDGKSA